MFTKYDVKSVTLRTKGVSTLGGRKVWFDPDILRINYDGQGTYLGEFQSDDRVLVITKSGNYYLNTFDPTAHFDDDILRVEKFNPEKVWSLAFFDADQNFFYGKRFLLDATVKAQNFLGDNPASYIAVLSDREEATFRVAFKDPAKEALVLEMADFIGVKTPKGKGKRFSTLEIASITDITPAPPEPEDEPVPDEEQEEELTENLPEEEIIEESAEEPQPEEPVAETIVEETPAAPAKEETPVVDETPSEPEPQQEEPVTEEASSKEEKPVEEEPTAELKPKKKTSSRKKKEPAPEVGVPFEIISNVPEDSMPFQADEDGQLSLF